MGDIELNTVSIQARIQGGAAVELSKIEYSLLYWLLKRSPNVVAYKELARLVKGIEADLFNLSQLQASEFLKDHVKRLRKKIEQNPRRPIYLINIKGIGYCLQPYGGRHVNGERLNALRHDL